MPPPDLRPEDQAPMKPTNKELQTSKSFVAFLPVQFSENLSRFHKTLSVSFVQSVLEEHGDLKIIDEDEYSDRGRRRRGHRDQIGRAHV